MALIFDKTLLGEDIAAARDWEGVTMQGIADRIGTSYSTISRLERGQIEPTTDVLAKVLQWLEEDANKYFRYILD